jgi:hypothetical protein
MRKEAGKQTPSDETPIVAKPTQKPKETSGRHTTLKTDAQRLEGNRRDA